jgi:hypothetical protein
MQLVVQHGTVIAKQCATRILPLKLPQTFILAARLTTALHVLLGTSELAVIICPPESKTHTHIYLHIFCFEIIKIMVISEA